MGNSARKSTESKTNPKQNIVGVDMGLANYLVASNGFRVKNLMDFCPKRHVDSAESKKFGRSMSRLAREMVSQCEKGIACERISMKSFKQSCSKEFKKELQDLRWNQFFNVLQKNLKNNGKFLIRVDPAFTSTTCPRCKNTSKFNREGRLFKCSSCGFKEDSDIVGALNIKSKAEKQLEGKEVEEKTIINGMGVEEWNKIAEIERREIINSQMGLN